jgi:hypothetical protein
MIELTKECRTATEFSCGTTLPDFGHGEAIGTLLAVTIFVRRGVSSQFA